MARRNVFLLSVYPDASLKTARERRDEARKLLANDIDPSEHRKINKSAKADRAANSFETVAREWFAKQARGWVPAHADRIIRRMERDIFPWIGGKPIADIAAPQLLEVIRRELEPLTGRGRYVFPSARNPRGNRPISDNAILAAMRRMGIAKDEMSGHGFRAMASTTLDEVLGFPPHLIEHQLAHAVRDPLGRAYNRTAHLPERRKMMRNWADYLDKLKAGAEIISTHQSA